MDLDEAKGLVQKLAESRHGRGFFRKKSTGLVSTLPVPLMTPSYKDRLEEDLLARLDELTKKAGTLGEEIRAASSVVEKTLWVNPRDFSGLRHRTEQILRLARELAEVSAQIEALHAFRYTVKEGGTRRDGLRLGRTREPSSS